MSYALKTDFSNRKRYKGRLSILSKVQVAEEKIDAGVCVYKRWVWYFKHCSRFLAGASCELWGGLAISPSASPTITKPIHSLNYLASLLLSKSHQSSLFLTFTDIINWHGCANYANYLKDIFVAAKKWSCTDPTAHKAMQSQTTKAHEACSHGTLQRDERRNSGEFCLDTRQRNVNNLMEKQILSPELNFKVLRICLNRCD